MPECDDFGVSGGVFTALFLVVAGSNDTIALAHNGPNGKFTLVKCTLC